MTKVVMICTKFSENMYIDVLIIKLEFQKDIRYRQIITNFESFEFLIKFIILS